MKEHDKAEWNGSTISMVAFYEWPEPHEKTYELYKCDPLAIDCHYWIAADGECFGLASHSNDTCIAVVESMIHSAGTRQSYVTFANKNRAAFKAWQKKWSKRTSGTVDRFDASVKVSIAA